MSNREFGTCKNGKLLDFYLKSEKLYHLICDSVDFENDNKTTVIDKLKLEQFRKDVTDKEPFTDQIPFRIPKSNLECKNYFGKVIKKMTQIAKSVEEACDCKNDLEGECSEPGPLLQKWYKEPVIFEPVPIESSNIEYCRKSFQNWSCREFRLDYYPIGFIKTACDDGKLSNKYLDNEKKLQSASFISTVLIQHQNRLESTMVFHHAKKVMMYLAPI